MGAGSGLGQASATATVNVTRKPRPLLGSTSRKLQIVVFVVALYRNFRPLADQYLSIIEAQAACVGSQDLVPCNTELGVSREDYTITLLVGYAGERSNSRLPECGILMLYLPTTRYDLFPAAPPSKSVSVPWRKRNFFEER